MANISYAQNLEDIMLQRSLSHISSGFYIDVGANDPDFDSVTKKFYERGWRGINIEPVKAYFDKLEAARPRDINIQAVVSNQEGMCRFFEIEGTGISTTQKDVSDSHRENGFFSVEIDVEALTLASICEKYVDGPVHFLKIDVEGGTKTVLEGMDLTAIRPWIIVVEATKPMTQIEDFSEWEHIILGWNYEFVYADGLNRFYIASEHDELKEKFKFPPNIFDNYVLASAHIAAERRLEDQAQILILEQEKNTLEDALAEEQSKAQEAQARANALHHEITTLRQELATQYTRADNAEAELKQVATALQSSQEACAQASALAATLDHKNTHLEASLALFRDQLQTTQHHMAQLEKCRADLQASLAEQAEQARFNNERAEHLETMLHRVANSLSWRITAPLRGWGTRRRQKP